MSDALKSPFVWFGGKRKVAPQVWTALGDVDNRHTECLWLSPHCLSDDAQLELFA